MVTLANPRSREISRHVNDYESAKKFLGNRHSKRLANNTLVYRTGIHHYNRGAGDYKESSIAVRFHNTNIVEYLPNEKIIVNNGGYYTKTTMQRINQLLPVGRMETRGRGKWVYVIRDAVIPFSPDMTIDVSGKVIIVDTREGDIKRSGTRGRSSTAKRIDRIEREENPRSNPGKFDDIMGEFLYSIDHDQTTGSVDEGGWFGLVSGLTLPDAWDAVEQLGIDPKEFAEVADEHDWPLNAIISEDSQGFVEVYFYKENRELMRVWHKLEEEGNL